MKLILASASPRRAELLRNAGFVFEVHPAHADETPLPGERAEDYVRRLAESKAQAVANIAARAAGRAFVIGADTAVIARGQIGGQINGQIDRQILGKPADAADARRMLRHLSGRTHEVLTGIAIIRTPDGERATYAESTSVTFLPLSDANIDEYIATGEPFDKAGAYGIQGVAGRFVSRIEGCYFNVMGLPVSKLWQTLCAMGWRNDSPRVS